MRGKKHTIAKNQTKTTAFLMAMLLTLGSSTLLAGCGADSGNSSDKPLAAESSGKQEEKGDSQSGAASTAQNAEELPDSLKGDGIDWINRDPFADLPSVDDVLYDIQDFDLYAEMEIEGLIETEKKNEADGTAVLEYRTENEELIYSKYVGYGEDCYDAYVRGKSGRNLIIRYTNEDDLRTQVDIYAHDYKVSLSELNMDSEYGADRIIISQDGTEGMLLPENRTMELYHGEWFMSASNVFTPEGYTRYTAWWDGDTLNEDTFLVWENRSSVPYCGSELLNLGENNVYASFTMGKQTFFYSGNTQGPWYMTAVYHLIFDSPEAAAEFAEVRGMEVQEVIDGYGDPIWIIDTPEITLPISSDCENFISCATQEVDDEYIMDAVIDTEGEIIAFTNSLFSFEQ